MIKAAPPSEDEFGQIGVLGQIAHSRAHIAGVDPLDLAGALGGGEGNLIQQAFHHRVQAASADIFHRPIDLDRQIGKRVNGVVGELRSARSPTGPILLDQTGFGLAQNAPEIVSRQGFQLDPIGQSALQFGQQIAGLGDMESARGDE